MRIRRWAVSDAAKASDYLIIDWTDKIEFPYISTSEEPGPTAPPRGCRSFNNESGEIHAYHYRRCKIILDRQRIQCGVRHDDQLQIRVLSISGFMSVGERWYVSRPAIRFPASRRTAFPGRDESDSTGTGRRQFNQSRSTGRLNPRYPMTFSLAAGYGNEDFDGDELNNLPSHDGHPDWRLDGGNWRNSTDHEEFAISFVRQPDLAGRKAWTLSIPTQQLAAGLNTEAEGSARPTGICGGWAGTTIIRRVITGIRWIINWRQIRAAWCGR